MATIGSKCAKNLPSSEFIKGEDSFHKTCNSCRASKKRLYQVKSFTPAYTTPKLEPTFHQSIKTIQVNCFPQQPQSGEPSYVLLDLPSANKKTVSKAFDWHKCYARHLANKYQLDVYEAINDAYLQDIDKNIEEGQRQEFLMSLPILCAERQEKRESRAEKTRNERHVSKVSAFKRAGFDRAF